MDHNTAQKLSLKQVDRLMDVGNAKVLRKGRMFASHCLVHLPGDTAIREMSCRRRAEFRDIQCFGEVHFEQRPGARAQGQNVGRVFHKAGLRNINKCFMCMRHSGVILRQQSCLGQSFGDLVAVGTGKRLQDLNAAAMTVHVAEAADIHQNVEPQTLPGREFAQQFVMPAAMPRTQGNDLIAPRLFK